MAAYLARLALINIAMTSGIAFAWDLKKVYNSTNFFDPVAGFQFDTEDKNNGIVSYQTQSAAASKALLGTTEENHVYLGTQMQSNGQNRPSVKLRSTDSYHGGLFLFDVAHVPLGCGVWPALWMVGSQWPTHGEIDIIEQINYSPTNQYTLHTSDGCSMPGFNHPSCAWYQGCGKQGSPGSFGEEFNNNKGGVFAMQWNTKDNITIWFFKRGAIPDDIVSGKPNPLGWSKPEVVFPFGSACKADFFAAQNIIVNIELCGDWAGGSWASVPARGTGPTCQKLTMPSPSKPDWSCTDYIRSSSSCLSDAYWIINSIKIFQ